MNNIDEYFQWLRTVSLSEEKACDLIFFRFFFFFLVSVAWLLLLFCQIFGPLCVWFCSDKQRGPDGFENCVSLESGESSGDQMKNSLLICGIAEFQENRSHGTTKAIILLIFQLFNSFHISPPNILLKRGGELSFSYMFPCLTQIGPDSGLKQV